MIAADKPVNAVKLYKNYRKYRVIYQHNVEIAAEKSKIRDNFRAGGTIVFVRVDDEASHGMLFSFPLRGNECLCTNSEKWREIQ